MYARRSMNGFSMVGNCGGFLVFGFANRSAAMKGIIGLCGGDCAQEMNVCEQWISSKKNATDWN